MLLLLEECAINCHWCYVEYSRYLLDVMALCSLTIWKMDGLFEQEVCPGGGGGSSQIFVGGCATSGFQTPPFNKARRRRKFDPFVRQIRGKLGKNCLKMYDSEDFRKSLPLKSPRHAYFRDETSIFTRKGPCCIRGRPSLSSFTLMIISIIRERGLENDDKYHDL